MIHVWHTTTLRMGANTLLSCSLGTYEKDFLLFISELGYLFESIIECWNSVFQIDDVNLVPGTKNVWLHLRVPVAALVAEMHSCA